MAMTLLCVKEKHEDGNDFMRLLVSNEYSPEKERDAEGKVLPNQEWQHPDPLTLRYTEFGKFESPQSYVQFLDALLNLGVRQFGGHVRLIIDGAADTASGREQSWDKKLTQDEAHRQEMEAERERERMAEEERRKPIYEFCTRCGGQRESCKNPLHRGRKCMNCCGGIGDTENRYCANCLDLPYRELREKALGATIVYTGESETDDD